MYMHTLARFCESQRRFSLFSPLNIYHIFFSVCCVFRGCRVSPAVSPWLVPCVCCVCAPEALRRPSVCPAVCRAACPSLVSYQAQDSVTVWADAPRVYPRPCPLLPMCCRWLFCCPFRVLSCCLLPCVVRW